MKKVKILIPGLLVMMLSAIAMPVMAIGPQQAAEVGNNPHLTYFVGTAGAELTFLETPRDVSFLWINRETQPDVIFYFITAAIGQGRMNNAIVASGANWLDIVLNPTNYLNKWIYLSAESGGNTWNAPADSPDRGSHGMLYWQLRALGFSHAMALEDALKHPYGVYRLHVRTGQ